MARGPHPRLDEAMAWLEGHATAHTRADLARYGIVTADRVLGVSMADTRRLGALLGRDHALADALWRTSVFDARMLVAFVAEPAALTPQAVSKHLRALEQADLVRCTRLGREQIYALEPRRLAAARQCLECISHDWACHTGKNHPR